MHIYTRDHIFIQKTKKSRINSSHPQSKENRSFKIIIYPILIFIYLFIFVFALDSECSSNAPRESCENRELYPQL